MSVSKKVFITTTIASALFSRFIRLFIKERPYIVHGNTPKAGMLSMVAAWLTRRPFRIYMCLGLRYQSENGFKRRLLMVFEKFSCFCATKVICVKNQLINDSFCVSCKAFQRLCDGGCNVYLQLIGSMEQTLDSISGVNGKLVAFHSEDALYLNMKE